MLKNKDIKEFKNINIEDMFTYVDIDADNASQEVIYDFGYEDDCLSINLSLADLFMYTDKNKISACEYYYDFFDEISYKDFIHELVKNAEHYLVYLPHSTWRGSSGCGIVNSLEDAFYRGYDCSQYIQGVSKGNKALLLRESHHDVPMGHHALIIALTEKEYNSLENADFSKMQDFALKYMYLETNKRELLKTIVNI